MPSAIIIGAGPGLGSSLAQRFVNEGLCTTVVARRAQTLDLVAAQFRDGGSELFTMTADVSDETALVEALAKNVATRGLPDVAVYNAGLIQQDNLGELTQAEHTHAWAVNVGGAITASAYLLPLMADRGHGTLLLTGGMPRPVPEHMSLSLGKAGLRALGQMLASHYGPLGVHVATVTIPGAIVPGTGLDPDVLAGEYWRLHTQPEGGWQTETPVDDDVHRPGSPR